VALDFYTETLGFTMDFVHGGFYAAVRSGDFVIHLKLVDAPDPSVGFVQAEDHLHLCLER
jgi:hypothetical protein